MNSCIYRAVISFVVVNVWIAANPSTACAEALLTPEELFQKAMELMAANQYAEACPLLEESRRRDPGIGTRFQLGRCYENTGRVASAWTLYKEVADEAQRTEQRERAATARKAADKLEPRVPKLVIEVPEAVAKITGVQVRDNQNLLNPPLWGESLPVDPGKHTITVTAPGRPDWQKGIVMAEGSVESVKVGEPPPPPEKGSAARYIVTIALGATGIASIVMGSYYGDKAMKDWDKVLKWCEAGDKTKCDRAKTDAEYSKLGVKKSAHISTATFVVGGVALAGAAVAFALWPKKKSEERSSTALQLTFVPAPGGGAIVAGGAF